MAKFEKGKSGNPGGRPSSAVKTAEVRQALIGAAPRILKRLIELALDGDVSAAKIVLDRIMPPLKPTEPPTTLEIKKSWSLSRQADAIQQSVYAGELTISQAQGLIGNLLSQAKIVEASELEERLAAIEQALAAK